MSDETNDPSPKPPRKNKAASKSKAKTKAKAKAKAKARAKAKATATTSRKSAAKPKAKTTRKSPAKSPARSPAKSTVPNESARRSESSGTSDGIDGTPVEARPDTPDSVAVPAQVEFTIDGDVVQVAAGTTILAACRDRGDDTIPTLCYGDTIRPKNACRICMVDVEGSRTLVPACSRPAEDGMVVRTRSERVDHARKMVLEFLGSAVDLSLTDGIAAWNDEYGADPSRYGSNVATVDQPVKADNPLYVRDYAKCIQCYQCVDACGDEWQHSFVISIARRGFEARVSTEFDVELPDSACVYCGNCIEVCPTGALMPTAEFDLRAVGRWDESRQSVTSTICAFCGVGCNLDLHVQDGTIVKVTSPSDSPITHGNLCIKGRFGFQHAQNR